MKKDLSIKKLIKALKPFTEDQIEQDGDVVILYALKTCNGDEPLLQDALSEEGDLAHVIYPYLDELTVDELVKIMENHLKIKDLDHTLYPSQWPSEDLGAYPAKLAEALVKTSDNESITDLFNIFYAHRDLSNEAVDVFMKDVLEDPKAVTQGMIDRSQEWDPEYVPDMLNEIAKKYPQFVEQAKHRFNL